ncbi:MAG: heparan-alpha-glucosaminide N-acetyltransferase domain-containing protein [Ferruginibacter sp.]|nr:heparan-alpha-glucosaminide N-acetyltransferase domain-containing protein [Ferruginibacter sp.]
MQPSVAIPNPSSNTINIPKRIDSIDILRGIVMVIMALDHTRDFFHTTANIDDPLNLATTSPLLYFTRWITHFCAPIFVFLSGVSIYLQSLRKTKNELSSFLFKRGLWLIFAEIAIVSLGITFNHI